MMEWGADNLSVRREHWVIHYKLTLHRYAGIFSARGAVHNRAFSREGRHAASVLARQPGPVMDFSKLFAHLERDTGARARGCRA
jgi:hypothetical protein